MNATEVDYVPQRICDMYMRSLEERMDYEKSIMDEKFERFQAVVERSLTEIKASVNDVRADVRVLSERLDEKFNSLSTRIDGLEKRIDDPHHSNNKWLAVFGVLFAAAAVVAPVVANVVQYYLTK